MIASIKGHLIETTPTGVVIEAGGLGYEVECSPTASHAFGVGEEAYLYTHQVIREDQHLLFGFEDRIQRDLFRLLIRLNGVGPKLGLTILSSLSVSQFIQCVRQESIAGLTSISGIGKKTAERILVEMRDKLDASWDAYSIDFQSSASGAKDKDAVVRASRRTALAEAEQALVALGYSSSLARSSLADVSPEVVEVSALIKEGLRLLSQARSVS